MYKLESRVNSIIKISLAFIIGLAITIFIMEPLYEAFGIAFQGNVWIIWFAIAYLVYTFISVWSRLSAQGKTKKLIIPSTNWIILMVSIIVILVPLFIGKNK